MSSVGPTVLARYFLCWAQKQFRSFIIRKKVGVPMSFIDHDVLYSDDTGSKDWRRLNELANCPSTYWRKYARRKMRRIVRELLRGVRPRIQLETG